MVRGPLQKETQNKEIKKVLQLQQLRYHQTPRYRLLVSAVSVDSPNFHKMKNSLKNVNPQMSTRETSAQYWKGHCTHSRGVSVPLSLSSFLYVRTLRAVS